MISVGVSSIVYANDLNNRQLNISGLIITRACELVTSEIDVDFGVISAPQIMNDMAPKEDFEISLNNCPKANIRAVFTGNTDSNHQLLNVTSSSTARGIGVRIYDEKDHIVTFGETPTSGTTGINGVVHTLRFKAQVAKLPEVESIRDIKEGTFSASATYEVIYD
ncbi:hypothetical protein AOY20_03990 [Acinetobacter equi]|uniref:Fimbrial-type adhesion domain-containing protein n=1 Tax=Acinetobacter equi TaxID=1324350 RepID=A0A0N9VUF6_9GAMM|nr:hypothetical protein AOY20_03990 [Acinetobacter equi]